MQSYLVQWRGEGSRLKQEMHWGTAVLGQGMDVSAREITVEVVSISEHKEGCKLSKGRMSVT